MEKEVELDDSHIMDINLTKSRQNIPITENEEVDESLEVIEISKLLIGLHKLVLSDIFEAGDDLVKNGKLPSYEKKQAQEEVDIRGVLKKDIRRGS